MSGFSESAHPRQPSGSEKGGEFASKSVGWMSAEGLSPTENFETSTGAVLRGVAVSTQQSLRKSTPLEASPEQHAFEDSLTTPEMDAIDSDGDEMQLSYVGPGSGAAAHGSYKVNSFLKGTRMPEDETEAKDIARLDKNLSSAIEKSPPLPKGTVLWRGARGAPEKFAHLVPGVEFEDKGYSSTSLSQAHAERFTGAAPSIGVTATNKTVFRIVSKRGMFVSSRLSKHYKEKEVLLQKGTKFKVTDRVTSENKTVIYLETLDA